MDPGRKCEEQQKERIYQSISSLFFLNEFEYCSFCQIVLIPIIPK